MLRSTFDRLLSYAGLLLAALLIIVSALAFWGYSFANANVHDQLSAQKITMPVAAATSTLSADDQAALAPFAGQPLDNGNAAKAYADHYIWAHMKASANQVMGKDATYSEASSACMAATKTAPTDDKTKALCDLRETLFMGNTLRSMLLTAYAFGTIATIALIGAIVTLVGGIAMLVLGIMGLNHAKRAGDAVVGGTPTH